MNPPRTIAAAKRPQPVEFRKVEIKEFPSANPGAEVGKSLPESAPDKIDKPSLKVESSVIVKVQTAGYDDASLDSTSTIVPKNSKGTVIKISRDKKFCLVRLTITREPEVWILFDKLEVE